MVVLLKKEMCSCCFKGICVGQSITECDKCTNLIHTRCYKKSQFTFTNNLYYCDSCINSIPHQYNPFKIDHIQSPTNSDDDHFYNENIYETIDCLSHASSILQNCAYYTSRELDAKIGTLSNFTNLFSNVDGNKSNFDTFVSELSTFEHKFSVIGLAETNVDPQQSSLYPIDNYNSFYNETLCDKSKGTGVALYVHNSLNASINKSLCTTTPDIESIFLKITYSGKCVDVGAIYRPPNGNIDEFLNEYQTIIQQLPVTPTFIMGDFNFNLLEVNNPKTEHFEEIFLSQGLYPSISLATHKRGDSRGTCIDNIFTNSIDDLAQSGIIHDIGTHHSAIFITTNLDLNQTARTSTKTPHTQYYNFSKSNINNLVDDLESNVDKLLGPDPKKPDFATFCNIFTVAVDKACKLDKPRITKRTTTNNPWITDSIITAIENKRKMYEKWNKSRSKKIPKGDPNLHKEFSDYRRNLKKIIKTAKSKFYGLKIKESSNNPKKTWEVINQIRGKNKRTVKPSFIINNERIIERRAIANEFNKYFASLASNMNKVFETDPGIPITPIQTFENYITKRNLNSIFLFECTEDEISKIISELDNNKASDFPIKIIKQCSHILTPTLVCHFNYLMEIGIFPNELKTGKITPIFKKGNEELLENYRPISTLPIFGKIFEKIIYKRLYSFLVSQGLLHERQFGFRQNHSTSHALNHSINYIDQGLQRGEHVLGIFIDLSKAFDTIDHKILLSKLELYGVRGIAHSLLKSYLSDRSQYVSTLGETSGELPVEYGVPQGSCLGPLLFIIYINDIVNICNIISKNCELVLFADDTNIFAKGDSKAQVYDLANNILKLVSEFMKSNKLHINMGKCCYMYFHRQKNKVNDNNEKDIKIDNYIIKRVSETKFLGVTIDENLNWNAHINQLTKKLASCTGILNRIKVSIPAYLHKDLYHTLFESHLVYGITVWGGVSQNRLLPLFRAQKKCIRILFGDKEAYMNKSKTCARSRPFDHQLLCSEYYMKEHSKPLFKEQQLMTVHNLHFYHCMSNAFQILKYRSPIALFDLFKLSGRKDTLLITPFPSNTFAYKANVLWNLSRQSSGINDLSHSTSQFKTSTKKLIHKHQSLGCIENWECINFITSYLESGKLVKS